MACFIRPIVLFLFLLFLVRCTLKRLPDQSFGSQCACSFERLVPNMSCFIRPIVLRPIVLRPIVLRPIVLFLFLFLVRCVLKRSPG